MTDQEMLWEYGGDILRSPTMAREREIPQHGSTTCFDHSVAVRFAVSVWPENGAGMWTGAVWVRGALLHELFFV